MNNILGPLGLCYGSPEPYNKNSIIPTPAENIYMFYFISLYTDGVTDPLYTDGTQPILNLTGNDYSDYNNFISNGTLPLTDQVVTVSDSTATVEVTKTLGSLKIEIELTDRPLPPVGINNPLYILGTVEMWSKYVDSNGNIPANRYIESMEFQTITKQNGFRLTPPVTPGGPGFSFALFRGNPGDRTYPGVLQPNGYYKSIFAVSLPTMPSFSFGNATLATYYMRGYVYPFSIPYSADIQITS